MFLNPYILAGLGGAVIPLLLHLLARARYRNIDWGAMMFLEGITPRHSQSARARQAILLGLRMLLVATIAVAMARPVLRGQWGGMLPDTPIRAVIVIDRSCSMAYEEAGRSRFEKAREAALQILSGLRRGDEVAVLTIGDQGGKTPELTTNLQLAARDIADLQVSSGSADIATAIADARKVLEQPGRFARELYLICDRQAAGWQKISPVSLDAKWLADPKSPTRFYVVPVGGEEVDNVAVESIELADPVTVRHHPAQVEVKLRNYGPHPRLGAELSLSSTPPSRRGVVNIPVNIPAQSTATVRASMIFDQAGSHVISASINAPGLDADNRLDSAIDVIEPIPVLIVSGDEAGPQLRRESTFLRLALAPYQANRGRNGDPAAVTVKTAEEFAAINLADYRVIILLNVPEISIDKARALEQKIYEGGGLIICPGSLARLDSYNNVLYRDGQGLLPAQLQPPTAADGSEATTIGKLDTSHPIFRFRSGDSTTPDAVIGRYYPATPRPDATVLASFDSGKPFLIEGKRGRGRVLLVTTPLDADWSTLPLDGSVAPTQGRPPDNASLIPASPFFLPFVQSMVQYACAPSQVSRNLAPGETLVATFAEPVESAELFRGDQRISNLSISGGGTQVRCAETKLPGTYRLHVRLRTPTNPNRTAYFVVQGPRGESDLAPLTSDQWEAYQRLLGFKRLDPANRSLAASISADRGGQELWLILLAAAMLLGALELWVGRLWSKEIA